MSNDRHGICKESRPIIGVPKVKEQSTPTKKFSDIMVKIEVAPICVNLESHVSEERWNKMSDKEKENFLLSISLPLAMRKTITVYYQENQNV